MASIEQIILAKLEPHAKRVADGEGNDFDYLPAVLLQVLEQQQRQAKLTVEAEKFFFSIERKIERIAETHSEQIAKTAAATMEEMERMESAIIKTQIQIQSSQNAMNERISMLASELDEHSKRSNEHLSAIGLRLESAAAEAQRSNAKLVKLSIAGFIATTAAIGLVFTILQRH